MSVQSLLLCSYTRFWNDVEMTFFSSSAWPEAPGVSPPRSPAFLFLSLFGGESGETTLSWLWATATVHPFPLSPPPPSSVGRKLEQRPCACVTLWAALCVWVCVSGRTSGLIHIILNRIFPSRVLLPPSFRSPPQDSRFSRKSAASPRARCLFWSIIVPEVQKQWVSTGVTPPTCHEMLNY